MHSFFLQVSKCFISVEKRKCNYLFVPLLELYAVNLLTIPFFSFLFFSFDTFLISFFLTFYALSDFAKSLIFMGIFYNKN